MGISVALVDDHAVVREAVAGMLVAQGDIAVVGQAGSLADGHALLDRAVRRSARRAASWRSSTSPCPTAAACPSCGPPASATRTSAWSCSPCSTTTPRLLEALDAGASALVRKSAPSEQVISAVRRAAEMPGEFSASGLAEAMRRQAETPQTTLTTRETEVLRLLVEGSSVAQVGRQLFMSPSTVKTHIGKIYDKLGAHNRASAVIAAVRLGLVADVDR